MKDIEAYKSCISTANLADTGFSYTLSLISGKYKMTILYSLPRSYHSPAASRRP